MKERLIWFKGKVVPLSEATINVLSPTCQFGANVFEGLRAYWNEDEGQLYIVKLEEHTQRLLDSIKMMRFETDFDRGFLSDSVKEVIVANDFKEDIAIRQTVFLDGFGSWFAKSPVEMFIAPIAKGRVLANNDAGIHCCISSWERINDNSVSPSIKCGANYINSRYGQLEALQNGYDQAVFLNNQGKVSEAPGSCLFYISKGKLITPAISASILDSVTRRIIIELARNELKLDVIDDQDIDRTSLYTADEMFLCGTAVEILPVFSVDKVLVGDGNIGSVTEAIRHLYLEVVRGKVKKYKHWLTPVY